MANPPSSSSEFKVDLGQLHDAIGIVKKQHDVISAELDNVASEFNGCRESWNTPSTASFDDVSTWFTNVSTDVNSVLAEMVSRMQAAYDNYTSAEEANVSNLEAHGKKLLGSSERFVVGSHGKKLLGSSERFVVGSHGKKLLRSSERFFVGGDAKKLLRVAAQPLDGNG
ncbi:WXG100 family type VII secretion target [Actinoallomurus purpureus]|uniref:WXG100 family type VII secretion target n=1 Tax=Actinoallomurus purpureus TaxID=478114 RepID=UPI002093B504|nr:WXG100 family type VII secretion target [Actinoallomurus purpureus]MCO6005341.1 WXG100 family type VII secretion target [Actinoallomurus purpureus]